MGEDSGNLPEVLADLEKYFVLQQRLRRQFFNQIADLQEYIQAYREVLFASLTLLHQLTGDRDRAERRYERLLNEHRSLRETVLQRAGRQ